MILSNDRNSLRATWQEAWRKAQAGEPLTPLEAQLAELLEMHPEYRAGIAAASVLERDYLPEGGESNPFLHLGMHQAIREQVATDRPAGIAALYRRAVKRTGDRHAVEHGFMECLGKMLWEAGRSGGMPDERAYLECLRKRG